VNDLNPGVTGTNTDINPAAFIRQRTDALLAALVNLIGTLECFGVIEPGTFAWEPELEVGEEDTLENL
jgi:hypothetical protein